MNEKKSQPLVAICYDAEMRDEAISFFINEL